MQTLEQAASRRNDFPHVNTDQMVSLPVWGKPSFPAAVLIERITHRPPETCRTLAALAGFRELEA